MKKLSVLLVIGLFCIPMMVYGFTKTGLPSVISNSISKGYHTIVKIASRSQDRSTSLIQPQADPELPPAENPFIQEPWGAKGVVTAIDTVNKIVTLQDAKYFNPAQNQFVTSDLTIYIQPSTYYYMNLTEMSNFESITEGSTIICNGPVDFLEKSIKETSDIFMGRFIPEDAAAPVTFIGPVKSYDSASRTIVFDYYGENGTAYEIHAVVNDETQVFSYMQAAPQFPNGPTPGVVPEFVKEYTPMNGVFIIKSDLTAVAHLINFYEN